ncbi:MAG: hypothetical protein ACYC3N_00160 [Halothiobacillus sp.]|jgi:hypothetical protein
MESLVDEHDPEVFFESNAEILRELGEFDEIYFKEQERWGGFDTVLDTLILQSQVIDELRNADWQSAWQLLHAVKEMQRRFSERLDEIASLINKEDE